MLQGFITSMNTNLMSEWWAHNKSANFPSWLITVCWYCIHGFYHDLMAEYVINGHLLKDSLYIMPKQVILAFYKWLNEGWYTETVYNAMTKKNSKSLPEFASMKWSQVIIGSVQSYSHRVGALGSCTLHLFQTWKYVPKAKLLVISPS